MRNAGINSHDSHSYKIILELNINLNLCECMKYAEFYTLKEYILVY